MKDYTNNNPVFSKSISIVEDGDFITAENATNALKQLLQNDLAICEMLINQDALGEAFFEVYGKNIQNDIQDPSGVDIETFFDPDAVDEAFYEVYGKHTQSDTQELSENEIEQLISTPWDGNGDEDPNALQPEEIEYLVNTPWDGSGDADPKALQPYEIDLLLKN